MVVVRLMDTFPCSWPRFLGARFSAVGMSRRGALLVLLEREDFESRNPAKLVEIRRQDSVSAG